MGDSVYMVSIKVTESGYRHFVVPREVSIYIHQLECYIKNPDASKLKELYLNRFPPTKF